jgi:hypothetical protein
MSNRHGKINTMWGRHFTVEKIKSILEQPEKQIIYSRIDVPVVVEAYPSIVPVL